jgi:class 3 adenylate cyclase/DNA-binding winged helix-turn-helix (wHTH) protein
MEFRILGPLEVLREGEPVRLPGARERALLALLLLHANQALSQERLVHELWGEEPPGTARKSLQVRIAALRKALGPDRVATVGPGYLLRVEPDELDLNRLERLLEQADGADTAKAVDLLREALGLWRGPPLADFVYDPFAQTAIARLEELRLVALERRIDADLALGRHGEIVGELRTLVAEHPLRERLRGRLMLALYRQGRQADALDVYRETRRALVDELGLEPSGALQELEAAILRHDPSLDLPERSVAEDTPPSGAPSPPVGPVLRREERKFAAVLFADIVDSTALAEREDPEVVRSVVSQTFERLAGVVEDHGGTLEKFIGDAILAVFGVPIAHEDDPERAVRTALAMQRCVGELAEGAPQLALRIGIEAGEVLVDLDRVGGSRDRVLTGDAVNTAARVQQHAEPGSVLVGPVVQATTKQVVLYRERPSLDVKGKARPLPVWEALRVRTATGERASLGLQARLVGRDHELALLERTLSWMRSERRPALVTILGSAGVGKSRLAQELCGRLEQIDATACVRQGRCLAYGNVSYSALADAVKAECGIREDDPPCVVSEKTAGRAEELFGDSEVAPYLNALVGAGDSFGREDLFDAWRRFVERIAARSPLVLVLEDIHWADDGLLDFVEHLADWAQGPMLVLTLARPELLERRPGWGGGKRNYSAIFLEPLTSDETEEMLEDLLSTRLPEELTRTIVERSEGNPLFGEEIVRMLIDRGILRAGGSEGWEVARAAAEVEIPRSVQALISARLDSLPLDEKAILQDAAVVGRAFWLGAVAHLASCVRDEARDTLSRLWMKEIVLPREPPAFSGEQEFVFRHVLIRDAAYESLTKSLRAEKHLEVARWAEDQAGERREEIAELLAAHYAHALRYLDELGVRDGSRLAAEREGLRWAKAAGERALRLWQQREAVRWFRAALDLAERVGLSSDALASLWEAYATAGEEAVAYGEVASALESALALYEELGRDRDAGRIEAHLAYIAQQSGELDEVLPWTTRALARLEPLGDSRDLAVALHVLGWHEFRTVRFEEAERHLRSALEMAERVGDHVVRAHALASLAFVFQQTQRGEDSLALFEDSLALAREAGDLSLLLRVLVHIEGALEEFPGDYQRAIELAHEGLELARRAGNTANVAWTTQMLSDFALDLGRLDESGRWAAQALEASRAVGDAIVVGYSLERIAYLHAVRGNPDEAERVLAEARPILDENPEPWLQGWAPLIAGHIAQGRGSDEEAAEVLADGARPLLGRILVWGGRSLLLECVRSLVRVGRADDARTFRDRLGTLAITSVPAQAMLAWADGLLEPDPPAARDRLVEATLRLEELGNQIELGRCLIDLASAERRLGEEPSPTLARAQEILESCGAHLFLREFNALSLEAAD